MDTVNASFFDTVCTFFFTEARRIAGQCLRQVFFFVHGVDEFTDHGVFAGTDQVQVFTFDLIHHRIHFCKAHNACYNVAADHERRDAVFEASADHEISCISQNCGVQSCDIAHQVVETVTSYFSSAVQVDAAEAFHNICVVRDFEIRNNGFAESFYFHVFAVVFTDGNGRIDDVRNGHHDFFDAFFYIFFFCCQFVNAFCISSDLCFYFFGFFFFAFCHQTADLFGQFISLCTQSFYFLFDGSVFLIQFDNFVYQRQFAVLEFLTDIFLNDFRVFSYKFDV